MESQPHGQHQPTGSTTWGKWVLVGFLIVTAFFLWTEHRAHALGALPYLLLLACPLMHFFHHGRGGHHGASSKREVGDGEHHRENHRG